VLAQKASRGRGATTAAPLRELGEHPDGGPVQVMEGRYGPYVKWSKVNATLPKDAQPETTTLEEALALIAAKAAKGGKGGRSRSTTKAKAATPKATTAKTTKPKTAKPKAPAKRAAKG
jgi:DNA topoisomerase-1